MAGSIPVVGSSSNTIGGSPTRATAALNFLLLPPLEGEERRGRRLREMEREEEKERKGQ